MSHRRRAKHELSFTERLMKAATEARGKAELLPPGREKDEMMERAREFDKQLEMNAFLKTPGVYLS